MYVFIYNIIFFFTEISYKCAIFVKEREEIASFVNNFLFLIIA